MDMNYAIPMEVSMKRKIVLSWILSFFLLFSAGAANDQAQAKKAVFDGQAAWTYIRDLSTDAMQGRQSGTPGGRMGAEYIASKFKEWSLEPAGEKGGYFQNFTIDLTVVEPTPVLEISTAKSKCEFVYREDWSNGGFSGSQNTVADVVWVGYGISAPPKDYDDYAGLDVKGKLVLFSSDTPRRFEEKLKDEAQFDNRIKAAQMHGAVGALTFRALDPNIGPGLPSFWFAPNIKKENYKKEFAIIALEQKIVDFIFKDPLTDYRYLQQQIEATGKPQPFAIETRAYLKLRVTANDKAPAENILAKITGSDKNLKNEYVIIGGHMDGTGMDAFGEPKNAANDNASGTAVAMEIARVMKLNGARPKRTVIFAAWGAEEEGLLGSKHYTEHSTHPIEKTVTYINMDMVSHGDGKLNFRGIYYAPEIWDLLKSKLPKALLDKANPGRGGPGGSDHNYFLYKGVPAFAIMTSGYHFKYHRPGDDAELAKPEILKTVGDYVTACLDILASEPKNLILPLRQETYWWRYSTLTNFETPSIDKVLAEHKDEQDPVVKTQLAVIPDKEGLPGDALRIETLKGLWSAAENVKLSKVFSLFGAAGAGGMGTGGSTPARPSLIQGLISLNPFRDDTRWAEIFAGQGAAFVMLDTPAFLFADKGLSEEGRKIIDQLNKTKLLIIAKGLETAEAKVLLENYKKPFFWITKTVPDKDVIDLMKKNGTVIGLVFGKDEDGAAYFKRLDEAKKAVGAPTLAIVNKNSLWGKAAKDQYYKMLSEMFKAKYENMDFSMLFSGSFMSVLNRARTEATGQARSMVMMF